MDWLDGERLKPAHGRIDLIEIDSRYKSALTGGDGGAVGDDGHGDVGHEEEEERARGEGGVVVRARLWCFYLLLFFW